MKRMRRGSGKSAGSSSTSGTTSSGSSSSVSASRRSSVIDVVSVARFLEPRREPRAGLRALVVNLDEHGRDALRPLVAGALALRFRATLEPHDAVRQRRELLRELL